MKTAIRSIQRGVGILFRFGASDGQVNPIKDVSTAVIGGLRAFVRF